MRNRVAKLFTAVALVAVVFFALSVEPPAHSAPPPKPKTAEAKYSGNIKTKKFHENNCRYYGCTNCVAKFATRQEAIDAGFDPCGVCDP